MMIFQKRRGFILIMACFFCLGFLVSFLNREPKFNFAGHVIYCNPKAKINLNKDYTLQLWDYQWPIQDGTESYSNYLKNALTDFNKIYPRIKVQITLLDLFAGPSQLEKALKSDNAPDVYCSAGELPPFDFKRQIPVGLYLKPSEKNIYLPNIYQELSNENTLCYFPRWMSPGVWIGNDTLLNKAGISVYKIQSQGWSWEEFTSLSRKISADKFLLVGNLGAKGFFPQLIANSIDREILNGNIFPNQLEMSRTVDLIESLIRQNKIPKDCEQKMLSRFLKGQALILAGVKPTVYEFIEEQLSIHQADWKPVLLPVPAFTTGKDVLMIENGVISVYRNKRTMGADHLTAAIRLGQFLSCYSQTKPWEQMMVVPAARNVYENWLLNNNVNAELYQKIGEKRLGKTWFPVNEYYEKIYPVLNDFISRKLNREEIRQKLGY